MKITPYVHQGTLIERLKLVFPDEETFVETKKQSNLRFPSNSYLELDVWIPTYKICFEFQDIYHYTATWNVHMSKEEINKKDQMKISIVHGTGSTLIIVPCWWDGEVDSLVSSIHFQRPDLVDNIKDIKPISMNPPYGYFPVHEVPDIGELMLASFSMDNNILTISERTWWMGEKYDGVRYCWNPVRKQMFSRTGKCLALPDNVTAFLPSVFLDSELWFGRGNFIATYPLVKSHEFIQWNLLRMMAFDIPDRSTSRDFFETRYNLLLQNINCEHPYVIVAPRIYCPNNDYLGLATQFIINDDGEGVILQKIGSLYESGRTESLLKLKTSVGDREAVVIGRDSDGSVTSQLPNGEIFVVSSKDVLIPTPSIGDVVTFISENNPRRENPINPKIYRVRKDLDWNDVMTRSVNEKHLNEKSRIAGFTSQPIGHWTKKNMRRFFEKYATHRGLDPLLPSTWYKFGAKEIVNTKGGTTIIQKLKGYFKSLKFLFPEMRLDQYELKRKSWIEISNRKKFFEDYAELNGFDPYNPENWYSQPRRKIETHKGGSTILLHHGNLYQALVDVFPTIGLEPLGFRQHRYLDKESRVKFFEQYARENGFEPLNPENWYLQPTKKILAIKGAYTVIGYHKGRVSTALLDLFPNIGLDKSKFYRHFDGWSDEENRRRFFERFASMHRFSPLIESNWYSPQTKNKFINARCALSILAFHNNNYEQALSELFPEFAS